MNRAFPFSFAKMREKDWTTARISLKLVTRGLVLVLLGMVYNGLFTKGFGEVRWASVLGRIGLGWMFAAKRLLVTDATEEGAYYLFSLSPDGLSAEYKGYDGG